MLNNVFALGKKMIREINRTVNIVDIVMQLLFILYYGYSLYVNLSNIVLLGLFSALILIAIILFIVTLCTYRSEEEAKKAVKKKAKKILKYARWPIRAVILGINGYLLLQKPGDALTLILLLVSAVFLLGQIVFEFIANYIGNYYRLMLNSLAMDVEELSPIMKRIVEKIGIGSFLEKNVQEDEDITAKINAIKLEMDFISLMRSYKKGSAKLNKGKIIRRFERCYKLSLNDKYLEKKNKKMLKRVTIRLKHLPKSSFLDHLILFTFIAKSHGQAEGSLSLDYSSLRLVVSSLLYISKKSKKKLVSSVIFPDDEAVISIVGELIHSDLFGRDGYINEVKRANPKKLKNGNEEASEDKIKHSDIKEILLRLKRK